MNLDVSAKELFALRISAPVLAMTYHMALGKRQQYFLIGVSILTLLTFYFFGFREEEEEIQKPEISLYKSDESVLTNGFLVHTPGCKIPEMDPYDVSVRKYLKQSSFPPCNDLLPLVESNQTSIWIVEEALRNYNVSDSSELECCYSELRRPNNMEDIKNADNTVDISNKCILFNNSANVQFEFVRVQCRAKGALIYRDFHAFIVPKVKDYSQWVEKNLDNSWEPEVSVLIIGADTLSRLNFHRTMPKTKNFLDYLGAIEFFGYNKVQYNTFPNMVALLTGYSVDEISFCWPKQDSHLDDCPWIWKNFSANNYMTAFAEDACWMGIFSYEKVGFRKPPTDYYGRPFMYAGETIAGRNKIASANFCIGERYCTEVLFDYAYKFLVNMTLSNKKFWGFFWESSLTHDFLTGPSQTDDIFYNLFEKLQNNKILNNTVVFFISDHGMRWGDIRTTYQGRMEEHLPFLFVILPDWFKERYTLAVRNLQRNTHLLTTPFDVHETMKDLLDLNSLDPDNIHARNLEVGTKRSFSLFLKGAVDRTCDSAGIKPNWCTCQRKRKVSTSDVIVQDSAALAINYLNAMLEKYKECAQLQLKEIVAAHVETEDESLKPKHSTHSISDFVVTFITVPGLGKFESVVRQRSDSNELTIVSEISRINRYNDQSSCISDLRLKLYCYCLDV